MRIHFLLALLVSLAINANAQSSRLGSLGNSPFSRIGLGEMLPEGGSRQQALGEAGSAASSNEQINLLNPAGLYYNRTVNLEFIARSVLRNAGDGTSTLKSGSWAPQHLSLVFPVARPLTLAVGIRHHTAIDYNVVSSGSIIAGPGDTTKFANYNQGSGGLAHAFVGAGLKIYKGFTAGVLLNYYFGTITRINDGNLNPYFVTQSTRTRVSDIQFKTGLAWRGYVGKYRLGVALAGDLPRALRATDEVIVEKYQVVGSGVTLVSRDTTNKSTASTIQAPTSYRLGLSVEQPNKYLLAADLVRERWSNVNGINITDGLKDCWKAGLGTEWIPNYNGTRYLQLVTYRAGISYKQLPLAVGDKRYSDVAATLGLGLPIIRKEARYTRPSINLNLSAGRRSLFNGSGVRETYVSMTIGVVMNDSQWFVRYKID